MRLSYGRNAGSIPEPAIGGSHLVEGVFTDSLWSEAERKAFVVGKKYTPTEWAETFRYLPPSVSAESGSYRVSRTPYLQGIMDCVIDPTVEEIVVLKAAQVGFSEAIRNLLGYWVDADSGPCLFVMPSQQAAEDTMNERIRPLFAETPQLKQHLSDNPTDNTKLHIRCDTMSVYMAWAGSPQALASRPIRFCLLDEVDKYQQFSGREADPISLARERTKTFKHRRKILIGSTPTTRLGHIWRSWEECGDKRHYHCPCPHCGEFQRLVYMQCKYEKLDIADTTKLADAIENHRLAWYECKYCRKKITDAQKQKMLQGGVWLSEGQTIERTGEVIGERPKSKRVGFHISALYSPWVSFSQMAAEGIRCRNDPARSMNFRNSWLGEVFEERVEGVKASDIRERSKGADPKGTVPNWAAIAIASIDVQKGHFYWVLRCWGYGFKSQLVSYGTALTFTELTESLLQRTFQRQDGTTIPTTVLIDSGYRTDEVYEWGRSDNRIHVIKGAPKKLSAPYVVSKKPIDTFGIALTIVDVDYYKDRLATLRKDSDRWKVHRDVTEEYCQHLAAEHKIIVRDKKGRISFRWVPITSGSENHLFDCEVYNVLGADIAGVELLASDSAVTSTPTAATVAADEEQRVKGADVGAGSDWLSRFRQRY